MKRIFLLSCMAALLFALLSASALAATSPYYIEVDITNQIVTVYRKDDVSESGIVRQMICSTGAKSTPTIQGTFTLPEKTKSSERTEWYRFSDCWGKWATRIRGGYLFHSILYSSKTSGPTKASLNALGTPASHGCVRLQVGDAWWIAMNCPPGTKVKIYESGELDEELRELVMNHTFDVNEETYEQFTNGLSTLRLNSWGDRVRELQARLNLLGYDCGNPDGIFGQKTYDAVVLFQTQNGLKKKDGRVTEKVWNLIFSDSAVVAPIVDGSSGLHVQALQQALRTLCLYSGDITGVYDEATAQALLAYQKAFDYTQDGKPTASLCKAIVARAEQVRAQFDGGEYIAVGVSAQRELAKVNVKSTLKLRSKASTSASTVATLKKGDIVLVLEKSKYWSRVQFGEKLGYAKNTYLTFYTQEYASYVYATPTPVPTATPVPTPTPEPLQIASDTTLKLGDEGEAVENLQRALIALRLLSAEPTGIFDEATRDAVAQFQRVQGVQATGQADPALQTKLFAEEQRVKHEFRGMVYTSQTTETQAAMAKVSAKSVHLHKSASSGNALASLKKGTVVQVLDKGKSWTKVQYGTLVGYIGTRYLSFYTEERWTIEYVPLGTIEPTEAPEETPEPMETPAPEASEAPELGEAPEDTEVPEQSDDLTETLAPTEEPEAIEDLEPTEEPTPDPTATPMPRPMYAFVKSETSLYRIENGKAELARTALEGEWFEVIDCEGEFAQVRDGGAALYIPVRDIRLSETRPTPLPELTPEPAELEEETGEAAEAEEAA
ncbi:MAG: peptidoglycan-binding protein [Clostridia bacterium]|nr:peptidoglycan-binding protein [Clostridia bacterium]